jgi:uncharacterized repeat protein (TIGR03803 family)
MKAKSLQPVLRWAVVLTASLILISAAHAANQYKVLHRFGDLPAKVPDGGLVADSAGNLYGTTFYSNSGCNTYGCGTVFMLTRESGGAWKYSVIHRFKGRDGAHPAASLILDSSGNLYGTTSYGETKNKATVFELSPSGSHWKETVLHNFGAKELEGPDGALIFDAAGNLYGTAAGGGTKGNGGVFQLKHSGNTWQETVIYKFSGGADGSVPMGDLVSDSAGNLYSTTYQGGQASQGVVIELAPSGGGWTETVLHSFTGFNAGDGAYPRGGVVFDTLGNLYGTTYSGGTYMNCAAACGTVYELTPSMGTWTETVLHSFNGSDGAGPYGDLVLDSAENLYATTSYGGGPDAGVVFKLSRSGNSWTEITLHVFDWKGETNPLSGLILDQGILYGTAFGFNQDYGAVFSITP